VVAFFKLEIASKKAFNVVLSEGLLYKTCSVSKSTSTALSYSISLFIISIREFIAVELP